MYDVRFLTLVPLASSVEGTRILAGSTASPSSGEKTSPKGKNKQRKSNPFWDVVSLVVAYAGQQAAERRQQQQQQQQQQQRGAALLLWLLFNLQERLHGL